MFEIIEMGKRAKRNNMQDNMQDKQHTYTKTGNTWALLPMLVFIVLYFGALVLIQNAPVVAHYMPSVPVVPFFLVALVVALMQNRSLSLANKAKIIGQGITSKSILTMLIIFLLAGIFTGIVGQSAARSVAYFLLDIFPPQCAVCVVFIVACLVSLAMGTSMGAITVLVPIACTVAFLSEQSAALCVASVICGGMFGDNLSVISDTTIACTSGQDCSMREKFIDNSAIALPAALITIVIIGLLSFNNSTQQHITESYNLIEFIPYLLTLVLGLVGVNVFAVFGCGIIAGIGVEMICNQQELMNILNNMITGALSMSELLMTTTTIVATSALIRKNGGFDAIMHLVGKTCKNRFSAQMGIGALVSLMDILTADNTIAIVISNPIAKEIAQSYDIERKRTATILDICSCVVQGLLPYGAQVLIALSLAASNGIQLSAADVIPLCIYQFVLLATLIIAIKKESFFKRKTE